MERQFSDMYALFRHDRNAEEYFDELPSYIQDQIRPRYKHVDSFDRLMGFADNLLRAR